MKRFFSFLILSSLMVAQGALAEAGNEVTVRVKGMVCDFCAQGVKKKFSGEAAVQDVNVNLSDKIIRLKLKDGQQLGNEKIQTLVQDSGFNVQEITRK